MNKKIISAIVPIAIAIIGLFAAGEGTSWSFDFSQTNIGQIGDNIINNYLSQEGIDIDEFRAMCDRGEVEETLVRYCGLV